MLVIISGKIFGMYVYFFSFVFLFSFNNIFFFFRVMLLIVNSYFFVYFSVEFGRIFILKFLLMIVKF